MGPSLRYVRPDFYGVDKKHFALLLRSLVFNFLPKIKKKIIYIAAVIVYTLSTVNGKFL